VAIVGQTSFVGCGPDGSGLPFFALLLASGALAAGGGYIGGGWMRKGVRLPAAIGLGMVALVAFYVVSFVAWAERCTN
jgi:hypothetical protein